MGVYIPGMGLPKSCAECKFKRYGVCIMGGYRSPRMPSEYLERPDWCPLVPVPTHGRLIDADKAIKSEQPSGVSDEQWALTTLARCIRNAPTIIPADGTNT